MKIKVSMRKEKITAVTLCLERNTKFLRTTENMGEFPIFANNRSGKVINLLQKESEEITGYISKNKPDLVVACSNQFFEKLVKQTQFHEIDVECIATKERHLVHYVTYGCEPCVVLITAK